MDNREFNFEELINKKSNEELLPLKNINNNFSNKLVEFLNKEKIVLSNDKKWWDKTYPMYKSMYENSSVYYNNSDDACVDDVDVYSGLITQTFIENNLILDKEYSNINLYTQKYDDKLVFINPVKNLYYFDMLFRELIDFDMEYVKNHKKSYNMVDSDFKKKFYMYCFKNSSKLFEN